MLERDFLLILDLHPAVELFEEQPIRIPWTDGQGDARVYVPDVLVRFHRGHQFLGRPTGIPLLVELKYRDDLGKHWRSLRPKLRAGFRAAAKLGCRFKILTEIQTRGIVLQNAEFVRKHLHGHFDHDAAGAIRTAVLDRGPISVEDLASSLSRHTRNTNQALDLVWALVSRGDLSVDLESPISPCSMINVGWRHAQR